MRLSYNSPVILSFALLSLGALVLGELTGGETTWALFTTYPAPLTDPLTYVRLFGHVLGHADWQHYIGNMLMLLVIGPPMEERYGGGALALSIAATALVSALAQWLLFPDTALLGASAEVQLGLFVAVSFVLLLFTRPLAKKLLRSGREEIKTNVDGLIGRTARVTETVDNELGTGAAVVSGQEWTARAFDGESRFAPGETVVIRAVEGVKLMVSESQREKE